MNSFTAILPASVSNSDKNVGTLFDLIGATFLKIVDQALDTVLDLPGAVREAVHVVITLPDGTGASLRDALIAIVTVLIGYGLATRLLAVRRASASQHAVPFVGLLMQAGYDLLALCISIICARLILVRGLLIQPVSDVFAAESVIALIRWLFVLAIIRFFLQPSAPRLRVNSIDDQGAAEAMKWAAWLSAFGHARVLSPVVV